MTIRLKRVYEAYEAGDDARVLVDRVWPRGVTKEAAHLDLWLREVAPSTELRKWFGHDPSRWEEFERRYAAELEACGEMLDAILEMEHHRKSVTLLYGARDTEHNQAVVLRSVLLARARHAHH